MTTDIKLTKSGEIYDISIDENGDIESGDFFDSSLLYSIFGEQRANEDEMPDPKRRRGWIGNQHSDYENGSKLWLYEQARVTRTLLNDITTTINNAVKWLIDDGLLKNITVNTELKNGVIVATLTLERFDSKVDVKYFDLWENTGR